VRESERESEEREKQRYRRKKKKREREVLRGMEKDGKKRNGREIVREGSIGKKERD